MWSYSEIPNTPYPTLGYVVSNRLPELINRKLKSRFSEEEKSRRVAYTDSDYAGASLDRKFTTGGCQFLGCILISWQCQKQTVVANSTTEVEYLVASNCCGQVLWIQNLLLDYGDSNGKKLIQMIKIHNDKNVVDLLTKAFDDVWNGMEKLVRMKLELVLCWEGLVIMLLDLKAEQVTVVTSIQTQSRQTLNEPNSLGNWFKYEVLGALRLTTGGHNWLNGFENVSKTSNDSLLAGVNTPQSDEDSMKLKELMDFCTKLQQRVLDLENTKIAQAWEITCLKLRVKKRMHPNRGGKIDVIDKDARLHWLMKLRGGQDMAEKEINVAEKEVSTADPVTTAGEVVTTASVEVSTASLTKTLTTDDLTLSQTLMEIKSAKPNVKGVV
ncbi:hypothetical protein Tco_0059408 [Tanacetum coccineum]